MNEYLISHGKTGGFGRFLSEQPLDCSRGERVIIRSQRGLELGNVLCPVTPQHQKMLGTAPSGRILRRATGEDEQQVQNLHTLGLNLFDEARSLATRQQLPCDILDVEVLFDGRQAILQFLAWEECDLDDFAIQLESKFQLAIMLEDLAAGPAEEEHGGCGQPGCGRATGGGCSNCGSGGCSSCGSGGVDMRDYFAHLRTKMEEHQQRMPLL